MRINLAKIFKVLITMMGTWEAPEKGMLNEGINK